MKRRRKKTTTTSPLLLLLLLVVLSLLPTVCLGQDDGGGEESSDSDVSDPGLVMGEDGSAIVDGSSGAGGGLSQLDNLKRQTLTALQELGVVIGVGFLVGLSFYFLGVAERIYEFVAMKVQIRFGKEMVKPMDAEDPASLVGTFKRCRNL